MQVQSTFREKMLFFFTINSIKIQYFIFPYIFEVITAAYVCGYLSRQKNMNK